MIVVLFPTMVVVFLFVVALAVCVQAGRPADATPAMSESENNEAASRLIRAAAGTDFAYRRLAQMCDTFGTRLSGSSNLEAAIDWALDEMKKDGLANVHGEEVSVPHWVRGSESAEMTAPRYRLLPMLGLGGSIATPSEGITAEVLVVKKFDDLRSANAAGKIVLFNEPFESYGKTVHIRTEGAIAAARAGAVASLVRSVTPFSLQSPHTGMMRYDDAVVKIPHAAITLEDAEMMQRMQDRGQKIVVRLKMSAVTLPNAMSRNVIAEILGREKPKEIVVVSGHIDSWDVGQGAMDDGGGAIAAWEAVRLMKQLGLRPRRTVRAVLWTNEENGLAGAREYARRHRDELANHVLAIESDRGPFQPIGFSFTGNDEALAMLKSLTSALGQINAAKFARDGDDADIAELHVSGVPTMALMVDGPKYFWYHHSDADTMDKLSAHEISACAAALAVMAFQVADAPTTLPR